MFLGAILKTCLKTLWYDLSADLGFTLETIFWIPILRFRAACASLNLLFRAILRVLNLLFRDFTALGVEITSICLVNKQADLILKTKPVEIPQVFTMRKCYDKWNGVTVAHPVDYTNVGLISTTFRCFRNPGLDTYPVLKPLSSSGYLVHADILLSFQFLRGR